MEVRRPYIVTYVRTHARVYACMHAYMHARVIKHLSVIQMVAEQCSSNGMQISTAITVRVPVCSARKLAYKRDDTVFWRI